MKEAINNLNERAVIKMKKTALAVLATLALAGCASGSDGTVAEPSQKPAEGTTAAPDGTSDTTDAPDTTRTTVERTTTTAEPTTTTVDMEKVGYMTVAAVMCSEVPFDAGFGIDWCDLDYDDPVFETMISSSCDFIEAVDPYGSMTSEEIFTQSAIISMDAVNSGTATFDEVSTMATMNGAVVGVRNEVCNG